VVGLTLGVVLALFGGLFWGMWGVGAGLTGLGYLGVPGWLASVLRAGRDGGWTLGSVLVSVWAMDTAAYFVGRSLGKRKLWERISPKKTLEGAAAGLSAAVGVYLGAWKLGLLAWSFWDCFALGAVVGVGGQIGDLIESAMKRDAGLKDSSGLIPGHGGVLDRFDSFLFAVPVVYLYLKLRGLI